jgi:hypothetical protein
MSLVVEPSAAGCPIEWLPAKDCSGWSPDVVAEHQRGIHVAIRNCGMWPDSGTEADYAALVDRAQREADLALELWGRWAHRTNPLPTGMRLELGSARLNGRFKTASAIAQARRERLHWLLCGCEGSA